MLTNLPPIHNHYTPWPRTNLGRYLATYRSMPPESRGWKTNGHGHYLPIQTLFGMFYLGWFQMAQLQTEAQGFTLHVQLGHWLFAWVSPWQRTCQSCKHFRQTSSYSYTDGYEYEEDCKKDFPNTWKDKPQSELTVDDFTHEAWRCPGYQYFDWDAYYKAQAKAEAAMIKQMQEDEARYESYLSSI